MIEVVFARLALAMIAVAVAVSVATYVVYVRRCGYVLDIEERIAAILVCVVEATVVFVAECLILIVVLLAIVAFGGAS